MAVKPPEDVLDAVAAAVAPARSVRVGLRWEQRERYHLTLQFLGPVPELAPVIDGLAAAAKERAAFSLQRAKCRAVRMRRSAGRSTEAVGGVGEPTVVCR